MNLVEIVDEFITSKNADLTRFFIIKTYTPSRLKNRSGWKKNPQWEPGHMRQNPHVGLSLCLLTFIGHLRCKMLII